MSTISRVGGETWWIMAVDFRARAPLDRALFMSRRSTTGAAASSPPLPPGEVVAAKPRRVRASVEWAGAIGPEGRQASSAHSRCADPSVILSGAKDLGPEDGTASGPRSFAPLRMTTSSGRPHRRTAGRTDTASTKPAQRPPSPQPSPGGRGVRSGPAVRGRTVSPTPCPGRSPGLGNGNPKGQQTKNPGLPPGATRHASKSGSVALAETHGSRSRPHPPETTRGGR